MEETPQPGSEEFWNQKISEIKKPLEMPPLPEPPKMPDFTQIEPKQNTAELPKDDQKDIKEPETQEKPIIDEPVIMPPVTDELPIENTPKEEATDTDELATEQSPDQPEIGPLTPEQMGRLKNLDTYVKSTKERQEEREQERYPGIFGRAQNWLNNTGWGRAVKIGGKLAFATAATLGAGALTGGLGLAAAPLLYSLGIKEGIDGAIEAAQYYIGKKSGRARRLAIEGEKAELHDYAQSQYQNAIEKMNNGEATPEETAFAINELAKKIRLREEIIMDDQNADLKQNQKEVAIRSTASFVGSLGVMLLTGIPLGIQNFDADKVLHAVKLSLHGFGYIQKIGETITASSYKVAGEFLHGLGTQYAMPLLGKIGVGVGLVGLLAKVGIDLRNVAKNRDIYEMPPDFLDANPTEQLDTPSPEENPGKQSETPEEDPTKIQELSDQDSNKKPTETDGAAQATETVADTGTTTLTQAPENLANAIDTATTEKLLEEKPAELAEFIKEVREKMAALRGELATVDSRLNELDKEWEKLDRDPKTSDVLTKQKEIENEHAGLSYQMRSLSAEIARFREAEQFISQIEDIDAQIKNLDYQFDTIDISHNTEADIKRLQEIEAQREQLVYNRAEIRQRLTQTYNLFETPAEQTQTPPTEVPPVVPESGTLAQHELETTAAGSEELQTETKEPLNVTTLESIIDFSKKTELESKEEYEASLDRATEVLKNVGGIVELRHNIPTVVLPDLHGRREMLASALAQKNEDGVTYYDLLKEGKINLVVMGDGMHTERAQSWTGDPEVLRKEMIASMGTMKMIMDLKAQFPESFHYVRGNHDKINGGFAKYDDESFTVKNWMIENMGQGLVDKWAQFENELPLLAMLNDPDHPIVISHTVANEPLTKEQIGDRDPLSRGDLYASENRGGLTWTDNTKMETSQEAIDSTLGNLGVPNAKWIIGHRPVHENGGRFRRQFGDKLIQMNNSQDHVMAVIPASGEFEPDRDVRII